MVTGRCARHAPGVQGWVLVGGADSREEGLFTVDAEDSDLEFTLEDLRAAERLTGGRRLASRGRPVVGAL